jgi:hypothetical protein
MTTLLTPDQEESLKSMTSLIMPPGQGRWYFCPHYYNDRGNGFYDVYTYEQLPASVKEEILKQRGIKL